MYVCIRMYMYLTYDYTCIYELEHKLTTANKHIYIYRYSKLYMYTYIYVCICVGMHTACQKKISIYMRTHIILHKYVNVKAFATRCAHTNK